jgi:hypothetical protein
VVVVMPDKVAVDEAGDRDGAELDEAKEEEQVKAGFLAVARGGSHRWEMAGLVMNEVGKWLPCCLVEMCFKLAMVWRFETQLVYSHTLSRSTAHSTDHRLIDNRDFRSSR